MKKFMPYLVIAGVALVSIYVYRNVLLKNFPSLPTI